MVHVHLDERLQPAEALALDEAQAGLVALGLVASAEGACGMSAPDADYELPTTSASLAGEALLPPFGFQALLCVLDLGGLPAAGYRPNPCNPEAADARSVA